MNKRVKRTTLVVIGVGAGLILGLALSPMVHTGIASAQTGPTAGQPSALVSTFLDKLAGALGIKRPALDAAIKTAADGTAADAVTKGQLTQPQADRLKQRLERGGVWGGMGRGDRAGFRMFGKTLLDAAAAALKETPQALMTELRSGKSLDAIAAAQGTTAKAVKDAVLAAAKTELDKAVAAKQMTQAQADAIYARLQKASTLPFGGWGPGMGGKGRGHRFDHDSTPGQNGTPGQNAKPGQSGSPTTPDL
jgi:hypothetical protein